MEFGCRRFKSYIHIFICIFISERHCVLNSSVYIIFSRSKLNQFKGFLGRYQHLKRSFLNEIGHILREEYRAAHTHPQDIPDTISSPTFDVK